MSLANDNSNAFESDKLYEQRKMITDYKSENHKKWLESMSTFQNIQSSKSFQIIKIKTLVSNAKKYELDCITNFKKKKLIQITKIHYDYHIARWKNIYNDNINLAQNDYYDFATFELSKAKFFSFNAILELYKTISVPSTLSFEDFLTSPSFSTSCIPSDSPNEEFLENVQISPTEPEKNLKFET